MKRELKALVHGFVDYLQAALGEQGAEPSAGVVPPNALIPAVFASAQPEEQVDFAEVAGAMREPDPFASPIFQQVVGDMRARDMMLEDPAASMRAGPVGAPVGPDLTRL
jgi:hypothetical protein